MNLPIVPLLQVSFLYLWNSLKLSVLFETGGTVQQALFLSLWLLFS